MEGKTAKEIYDESFDDKDMFPPLVLSACWLVRNNLGHYTLKDANPYNWMDVTHWAGDDRETWIPVTEKMQSEA